MSSSNIINRASREKIGASGSENLSDKPNLIQWESLSGNIIISILGTLGNNYRLFCCVNSPDVKFFLDLRKGGGTSVAKRLSESRRKGAAWPGCKRDSSISTGAATPPRCLRLPLRTTAGESTGSVLFLENTLPESWSCPSASQSAALLKRIKGQHK